NYQPLGVIDLGSPEKWEEDRPLHIPLEKLIVYEMHIRGFTKDQSSGCQHPGTYLGVIEKIDHLKALGVNAVEFLPLFEFNPFDTARCSLYYPTTLLNYWGYQTINFFSPMSRYASDNSPGAAVLECRQMIQALHTAGIEIILDVVFNHTGEGDGRGPALSFKGIDPETYYLFDSNGRYANYTGCGNTLNCNHPVVIQLILDALRYWVVDMHVDGFRFDLASIFLRGREGEPLTSSPLVEAISEDPILARTKLIAEPWDASGLYHVGHFASKKRRWAEWNDRYRDGVREFIKGTGEASECALRICGSQDLYHSTSPLSSLNYVTSHDGFTLRDLVSYNHKNNLANGENNADGSDHNHSWNCGSEGPTDDPDILRLREKQMRNYVLALMVSQGIPMFKMGDEYGHTKQGNNNTWCHDNALNWFQWNELDKNREFFRFCKLTFLLRQRLAIFRHSSFFTDLEVAWHGQAPYQPRWSSGSKLLALTLLDPANNCEAYVAFNTASQEVEVSLPQPKQGQSWHRKIDTDREAPKDILEWDEIETLEKMSYVLAPYSSIVLITKAVDQPFKPTA
ncbi:MAG: glycogen-debranching protein, partial [Chlamydiia bacterium]|nr:glycogen-debranching protein [Chlamydiia bacterium]